MNAPSNISGRKRTSVFKLNRSQAVRIPKDLAFPDEVKEVYVMRRGMKLEIVPVDALWDDFFATFPSSDIVEPEDLPLDEVASL